MTGDVGDRATLATAAGDEPPIPPDSQVGDYRVRGMIGEGATGQVYLAQDTKLGRRVALKVIKRSVMHADGLTRFLEEARMTASFNHPHIVTLHAVGEHEGRPFLALEYVDGESLRARIAAGPIPTREALRIARAVAEAIAEAHQRGLVHADLKPDNILIPRDGRVRVVDFGLAKLVGTARDAVSGTPAYMAPERWRGEPPTEAIDVWSFGMILYELVVGRRPVSDAALARLAFATAELPLPAVEASTGWGALVADCLAIAPSKRPAAAEVVRRLGALVEPRAHVGDTPDCPFPGLLAFAREDAAQYFGRRAELDELVELLRANPLVPIVGPSGIGKSSFVHAALIPRLEEADWTAIALRPGPAPFDRLAAATGDEGETLRQHPDRLSIVLAALAKRSRGRVLVFLDQFEETFTLAAADSIPFCESVARAAGADESWRIVLTIRDDFLGRLAEAPSMRRHLGSVLALGPLSAADLRTAVEGPLANAGYTTDTPELAARIVADVQSQPACLPLLQFACQSLWERRDVAGKRVLASEYAAIGGASGALATHAQRLMTQLSPQQVQVARSILLSLLNPDGTRRPRLRSELLGEVRDAAVVIDQLLERRLVVASREAERDDTRLELAHEALATAWPQLARWLDETYEERLLVLEIAQASMLWHRRGKRDDATWGGVALAEAVRRIAEWNIALPSTSRAFLDAGLRRERSSRRRRRWLTTIVIAVLGGAAIVATVAALAYSHKEDEAIAQQTQIRLAAADMGTVTLQLEPFDWDDANQRRVADSARVIRGWRLRAPATRSPQLPGRLYGPEDVHRGVPSWQAGALSETIDVRSGPAFLEVDRGSCNPSRVFLQRVPGFRERGVPAVLRIPVPSCAASSVAEVEIPAGRFFRNALRDTKSVDELASLPAFAIDRHEVTRAAFEVYETIGSLTGDVAAPADHLGLDKAKIGWTPIVGVTYGVALRYCAFHGKTLPTIEQWQKGFRGGLVVAGKPNPDPLRLTPWTARRTPRPANIDTAGPAPIGTHPDDVSPYGVVDLAGNVGEWTSSPAEYTRLRMVAGGSWSIPSAQHPDEITWRNARADADLAYDIGIRCVTAATATEP